MALRRPRSTDPLAAQHLTRRPEPTQTYWLGVRVADALAGHRDGKQEARLVIARAASKHGDQTVRSAPAEAGGDIPASSTPWLGRNEHTFGERDRREYLTLQATTAAVLAQLRGLHLDLAAQRDELAEARRSRASVDGEPSEAALGQRGAAERFDADATIRLRNRRAHAAMVASRDAAVEAAARRVLELQHEIAGLEGRLRTAFEVAVTRSERLRYFHERRAAVYRRSHQRAWRSRTRRLPAAPAATPLAASGIPAAPWTQEPFPWAQPESVSAGSR